MSRRAVHQLLTSLSYGDAIGNEALAIQARLRAAGFESDIFAEGWDAAMVERCRPLWQYRQVSFPETVCLYHFSIGSAAGRLIFHAPDRLVSIYHNITPAEFFVGFHGHLAGLCYHGRRELRAFAARTALGLGDSEFNRRELEAAGYERTGVLPIVLDFERYARKPSPLVRRLYADGRTNILFVGRIIPNKRIDELIRVFALYRRSDPRSRLLLVGDHRGHERYFGRLQQLVRELRLDSVVFSGHVDDDDLLAYYSVASVFLCLSEHEGYCVPLVEAMQFDVPVIAYDAGAVAETLRGGGVLLKQKPPALVAELIASLQSEPRLRQALLASQRRALAELRATDFGQLLEERLRPVLGDAGGRSRQAAPARRSVHQVLVSFHYGDAIGNEALAIRSHLRDAGYHSEIFAERCDVRLHGEARPLAEYAGRADASAVCLFHLSPGGRAARAVWEAPGRIALIYHNLTPARFFGGWNAEMARQAEQGRCLLREFAARAELALAKSEFSRRELEAQGYARTGVLPFVIDPARYERSPSPVVRRLYHDGRPNLLFVGRVVPNKRFEDLIRVFAAFRRLEPRSRLVLVGDHGGQEPYLAALSKLARALRVAEDVVFTGRVEDEELLAYYSVAHLFLCLSEHEGYCVPLVEAMRFDVPVVAYDAGAVAETLNGAGVLLREKEPALVAELLHALLSGGPLREGVLQAQRRVVERIVARDYRRLLLDGLAPLLAARRGH